jgi:hypothetical protein
VIGDRHLEREIGFRSERRAPVANNRQDGPAPLAQVGKLELASTEPARSATAPGVIAKNPTGKQNDGASVLSSGPRDYWDHPFSAP